LSRPFAPRTPPGPSYRINGKIRAREVRVIGPSGQALGVIGLAEALTLARNHAVDLVEIAPNAVPPVCRLVDFGKFRYEQSKKDKDSKKHQHANKVKEVQLSPNIDPHDFGVKLSHAIGFMCEDMKVKVLLRFRGREMAHKEIGQQVVERFLKEAAPWGQPDFSPKLMGKTINVMISPLPKNKRAKDPTLNDQGEIAGAELREPIAKPVFDAAQATTPQAAPIKSGKTSAEGFANSPFTGLDLTGPHA
jgi:translation initiation factor IF-3